MTALRGETLAFALAHAARAVGGVRAGAALPAALAQVTGRCDARARGAVHDLAYQTIRELGFADAVIAHWIAKPPAADVRDLLAVAIALLRGATTGGPVYAPHTIVAQTVDAAAAGDAGLRAAKGLINAVLRRLLREPQAADALVAADPVARWNLPVWWLRRLQAAWPQHWSAIAASAQTRPPLVLRINRRKTDVPRFAQQLADAGIATAVAGPAALRVLDPLPVQRIPGFADGLCSVQDAGAQRAAPLLDVRDGMRVLDACAAPGGKTGHLLELAELELVALEADADRAVRIQENLARLQLAATVKVGDAARPQGWWDGAPFDRILADVPCSASGIVRRHPDIRWLRRDADIAALAQTQRQIVDGLWPLLKPGGKLLYVTCSVFPDEGEAQAAGFVARHQDAVRLDAPGQLLPGVVDNMGDDAGDDGGSDGFFYALFEKRDDG